MAKTMYCWRCKMDVPMLDDEEWSRVRALLAPMQTIKDVRERHGVPLGDALKLASWEALHLYREITRFSETNPNALWHHQIAIYGAPCTACGKPLRTPRAKRCFECGEPRAERA
ncbi:MAG TPA: hypothetical protein VGD45_22935 [Steroidobacter sp.]|uniref:hypothetical protein n=1 Tax=Steroidobacter sp. TaxID=1978227 RepID=UPI002EDA0333